MTALSENIDKYFQHPLPVGASFRIFHPVSIPTECSEVEIYGTQDIETLGNHFFKSEENSGKRVRLEAEWNKFKSELADWAKDYQAMPSPTATSSEWAPQRFLRHKASYSKSYPLLLQVGEVCLSMAVSNAWPERGARALKRLKTHLRNCLKKQILESLLHITINGPPAKSSKLIVNQAAKLCKERKLSRSFHLQKKSVEQANVERDKEMEETAPLQQEQEELRKSKELFLKK